MRVLFITSSRLGDAILSMSLLHHLETLYKDISLTVVCGSLPAPLFQSIPFCERVIVTQKKSFNRHWFDVWKDVRQHTWDLVIDLRGTLLSYGLSVGKRVRWSKTILSKHPSYERLHQVERLRFLWMDAYRSLRSFHEDDLKNMTPKVWLSLAHLTHAQKTVTHPTLAIAPTANWMGKTWSIDFFQEVTKRFLITFPDHHILLMAAPFEGEAVHHIQSTLEDTLGDRMTVMLSSDLNEVAATLQQCDMFLGNDSGLMHMAAALNVPTIGLFGPSDDRRYGPFGERHIILRTPQTLKEIEALPGFSYKTHQSFMNDLSVDTVWNTLSHQWERMHVKIDHLADIPLWGKS